MAGPDQPEPGERPPGEPRPEEPRPGGPAAGAGASQGLSWSWELDFGSLAQALSEPPPWDRPGQATSGLWGSGAPGDPLAAEFAPDDLGADRAEPDDEAEPGQLADVFPAEWADQEAILAEETAATLSGRSRDVPIGAMAGRVAESLAPGPDLAGWLAATSPKAVEDGALPGVAASYRRLASWAQAGELAAVAELASRSAVADGRIGVDDEGRPAQVTDEAAAQVSLALTMTRFGACWWSDLAVTLTWRLAATGRALAAGDIDLARARLIAEATSMLDDDTARAVEARVLPSAGTATTSQLRAALRRAVIAADPVGADRRRQEAERRAKVSLYPDEEGTATLIGQNLPGTRAAAAMSRISAMARALKASGAAGGMDLLRAQVFIGLLLGTLPLIPPAPGSPPDEPPQGEPPSDEPPSDEPPSDGLPSDGLPSDGLPSDGLPSDGLPSDGLPPDEPPFAGAPGPDGHVPGSGDDVPGPGDRDLPGDEYPGDPLRGDPSWAEPQAGGRDGAEDDDWIISPVPAASWSAFPALILPSGAGPGPGPGRECAPPPSLDLTVPWMTLAGCSPEPGYLGRLGPITPDQAREVAEAAAADPAVQWRVILTSAAGRAVAVARIPAGPARNGRAGPARDGPAHLAPAHLAPGRITLTIPEDVLADPLPAGLVAGDVLDRALRAARRAAAAAAARSAADAAASGGCAHTTATASYRPPPRLRDYVVARDRTCRFPSCGQPAWRGDLDHTQPWDSGGLTCSCNLGGLCRHHHMLKQHPGWQLVQVRPGAFRWITPPGRSYPCAPDTYAA
jgi:hypothetical protein